MAITRCRPVEVRSSVLSFDLAYNRTAPNRAAARAWGSPLHADALELLLHMTLEDTVAGHAGACPGPAAAVFCRDSCGIVGQAERSGWVILGSDAGRR